MADEHLATSVCEWLLVRLAGRGRRTRGKGRRALVGCSEGELHALAVRMVADVLVEAGWSVLFLGAATPAGAWGPIVRARHPDLAVVGTTMASAWTPSGRRSSRSRPRVPSADGGRRPGLRGPPGGGGAS